MERINSQPGFVDAMTAELGGRRTGDLLTRLGSAIDWTRASAPIRALPEYRNEGAGRRPWSAELMLKCLMLQRWFNLSDPQLEEQLRDRISFRRFVGLALEDATPDETTFVRFRARLRESGLEQKVFENVLDQLGGRGLLVKEGTIVDATVIEQSRGSKGGDGSSTRDPDASYTRKHGRVYHGYKAHVASDRGGLITRCAMTTAKTHDSRAIDELVEGERVAVFADSAYDDRERRRRLRDRGVIDAIVYKRRRGQAKLRDWQLRWNRLVTPVRATGERVFAVLKRHMGWRRARYRGLDRNRSDLLLTAAAYNLKWSLSLSG